MNDTLRLLKIIAWILVIYGIFMLGVLFFGKIVMPLWKHIFVSCASLFGGAWLSYAIYKFDNRHLLYSTNIMGFKKQEIVSVVIACMAAVTWVISIGDSHVPFNRISYFCGGVIAVGIGWHFLIRYQIKKELKKQAQ